MYEQKQRTTHWRAIVSAVLAILGVVALSRGHDAVGAALKTLSGFPLRCLAIAILLGVTQNVCQSTRLWVLLPGPRRASWLDVFRAFNWGQLVNNYVPARAGDILKVALIRAVAPELQVGQESALTPTEASTSTRASAASIAGSVLIADKIADIGSLFVLMLLLVDPHSSALRPCTHDSDNVAFYASAFSSGAPHSIRSGAWILATA
jgi:uncharacterized membrane protein YbhN (UPF0104 family)